MQGIQALHGAGFCQRNLKCENILLDQNFNPKVSNFALSRLFIENNQNIQLKDRTGTPNYMPPQMHLHQTYSWDKADIFCLGIILFILVTWLKGFNNSKNDDHFYRHRKGNFIEYWDKVAEANPNAVNLSENFKNLYISMIDYNENNRPNIAQILEHNWFNEIKNLNNVQLLNL